MTEDQQDGEDAADESPDDTASDAIDDATGELGERDGTPDAAAVEAAADSLNAVREGGDLSDVRVSRIDRDGHEVTVTLTLPSGTTFTDDFSVPPVWGANCDLKRLLDAYGLGPDSMNELVGESVPCSREVRDGGLELHVDVDAL